MRARAINELNGAIRLREIWVYMALTDITQRYRQTVLGPLWNSAYLVGQAAALSLVFGTVFHSPLNTILPYILAGMTSWMLGPGAIIDSANLLLSASGTIKNQNLPYLTYALRMGTRNLMLFGHNLLAFLVIMPFFGHLPLVNPIVLVTATLIAVASAPFCLMLGMLCARFRDFGQLVQNFGPVLFFMTPVFWLTDKVEGPRRTLFTYNPFYYMINVIRKPLLGLWPNLTDLAVLLAILVVGWGLCLALLSMFRQRIPYWV